MSVIGAVLNTTMSLTENISVSNQIRQGYDMSEANKYEVVSDKFINDLFAGTNFGSAVNDSVDKKRELIAKTLHNQINGFWSGHTAYHIVVEGGFLIDAKSGEQKKLTALGQAFIELSTRKIGEV